MTEVRIRHENNIYAVSLGDVPLLEVDKVLPLLTRWGVVTKTGLLYDGGTAQPELSAQFTVVADEEAYFEVQIHDEEE